MVSVLLGIEIRWTYLPPIELITLELLLVNLFILPKEIIRMTLFL